MIKNNLLGLGMVTQEAEPGHLCEFQASQGSIPKSKQTKITTIKSLAERHNQTVGKLTRPVLTGEEASKRALSL